MSSDYKVWLCDTLCLGESIRILTFPPINKDLDYEAYVVFEHCYQSENFLDRIKAAWHILTKGYHLYGEILLSKEIAVEMSDYLFATANAITIAQNKRL